MVGWRAGSKERLIQLMLLITRGCTVKCGSQDADPHLGSTAAAHLVTNSLRKTRARKKRKHHTHCTYAGARNKPKVLPSEMGRSELDRTLHHQNCVIMVSSRRPVKTRKTPAIVLGPDEVIRNGRGFPHIPHFVVSGYRVTVHGGPPVRETIVPAGPSCHFGGRWRSTSKVDADPVAFLVGWERGKREGGIATCKRSAVQSLRRILQMK